MSERARNRKSHFCCLGADAQITASSDSRAAARTRTINCRDSRHTTFFERRQHAVDTRFVFDSMFRRLERTKLIDIGSGREGLVTGTLKHKDLDRAVVVRLTADLCKPLVHLEGEGIPCLRTVECGPSDAVLHIKKKVISR